MADKNDQDDFKPKGTIMVLAIFIITLIVLWGSVYWIMIDRGVF